MNFKIGMRVRVNKQVMVIGGLLGVIVRPQPHQIERRFACVKLVRPLRRYPNHRVSAWLVDRSMLRVAQ